MLELIAYKEMVICVHQTLFSGDSLRCFLVFQQEITV